MITRGLYYRWISPQHWLDRAGVRAPMQIVMGLVVLTLCVLLFADAIKLLPNPDEEALQKRSVISEVAAVQAASTVSHVNNPDVLHEMLESMVRQEKELASAGLRDQSGAIIAQTSKHEQNWKSAQLTGNSRTHIRVPLLKDRHPWGQLELCFASLPQAPVWSEWWQSPMVRLTTFVIAAHFVLYWLFLSRTLKPLDPSAAIPDRLQTLLDAMVQGAAVLDLRDNIVMTNQSFAAIAFSMKERLIGQPLSSLPWLEQDSDDIPDEFPWTIAKATGLQQKSVCLRLQIGVRHTRWLAVNTSPIFDVSGALRGILVTFDDLTVIEAENLQLNHCLASMSANGAILRKVRGELLPATQEQAAALNSLNQVIEEITRVCLFATSKSALPTPEKINDGYDGLATQSLDASSNPLGETWGHLGKERT